MASLVAFHSDQKPAMLLSISGISTFRHDFFSSSILLTPSPIQDEEIEPFLCAPTTIGTTPAYDPMTLSIRQLLPSGERNPEYVRPSKPAGTGTSSPKPLDRRCLYEYYLYNNKFSNLVEHVDPGFQWISDGASDEKLANWPRTIFIHCREDRDVSVDVTIAIAQYLTSTKADMFLTSGQGHLFEATSYLEDDNPGMDVVREAIEALDANFKS